jgi:separase
MPFGGKKGLDFTELRVAKGILDTTHALCHAYLARGSPKEADYYAQQASNLAESISADVFTARACLRRADIQLSSGHVDLTQDLLDKAHALLSHATTVDYTDAKRLYGVLSIAQGEDEDAREHFAQAAIALRELQESFQGLKGVKNSYVLDNILEISR